MVLVYRDRTKDTIFISYAFTRALQWEIKFVTRVYWIFVFITIEGVTVFFNEYGKPYYPDFVTPVSPELNIDVSAPGESRTIKILQETGLIK